MSEPRKFDWGKVIPPLTPGQIPTYPYTAAEWGAMMVKDFPIPLPPPAQRRNGLTQDPKIIEG